MTDILSTILITAGTSGITGFFTWVFTRKKYNAEVTGAQIENQGKSLDFYIKLSDDTNQRLEEILNKNKGLQEQVEKLKTDNEELRASIERQNVQITELTSKINNLNELLKGKT